MFDYDQGTGSGFPHFYTGFYNFINGFIRKISGTGAAQSIQLKNIGKNIGLSQVFQRFSKFRLQHNNDRNHSQTTQPGCNPQNGSHLEVEC